MIPQLYKKQNNLLTILQGTAPKKDIRRLYLIIYHLETIYNNYLIPIVYLTRTCCFFTLFMLK